MVICLNIFSLKESCIFITFKIMRIETMTVIFIVFKTALWCMRVIGAGNRITLLYSTRNNKGTPRCYYNFLNKDSVVFRINNIILKFSILLCWNLFLTQGILSWYCHLAPWMYLPFIVVFLCYVGLQLQNKWYSSRLY